MSHAMEGDNEREKEEPGTIFLLLFCVRLVVEIFTERA